MKSFRWTVIAAAGVSLLIALTVWDAKRNEQSQELKRQEEKVVGLAVDEISRVELRTRTGVIVMERQDEQWYMRRPVEDTADNQAVISLLASMESERVSARVVGAAEADLATYGLANTGEASPVTGLMIAAADGRKIEMRVGSIKAYDGSLYAQISQGSRDAASGDVVVVSSSWDGHLSQSVRQLRNKKLFRTNLEDEMMNIEIRNRGQSPVMLERLGEKWQIKGESYPVDATRVAAFIEQVKNLRGHEISDDDKMASGVLKQRGLDKPAFEIVFRSRVLKNEPGTQAREFSLLMSAPREQGGDVFATSSDSQSVLALVDSAADTIRKTSDDFFDRRLPFQFKESDVARLSIEAPGLKDEFVKKSDEWQQVALSADAKAQSKVESGRLKELVTKLSQLEAVRILGSAPGKIDTSALAKGESRIRLMNGKNETVFALVWGEKVTESSRSGGTPERTYRIARTSLVDRKLGISEASVDGLNISSLKTSETESGAVPEDKRQSSSTRGSVEPH
jgi:hypothetical protein